MPVRGGGGNGCWVGNQQRLPHLVEDTTDASNERAIICTGKNQPQKSGRFLLSPCSCSRNNGSDQRSSLRKSLAALSSAQLLQLLLSFNNTYKFQISSYYLNLNTNGIPWGSYKVSHTSLAPWCFRSKFTMGWNPSSSRTAQCMSPPPGYDVPPGASGGLQRDESTVILQTKNLRFFSRVLLCDHLEVLFAFKF